ncbi:MAG TPA: hypothetical protein VEQ63_07510, partial [Bryobacteraceae bacterium]|nr:hypothetical protein [Bryobacteraceae bacterium]
YRNSVAILAPVAGPFLRTGVCVSDGRIGISVRFASFAFRSSNTLNVVEHYGGIPAGFRFPLWATLPLSFVLMLLLLPACRWYASLRKSGCSEMDQLELRQHVREQVGPAGVPYRQLDRPSQHAE